MQLQLYLPFAFAAGGVFAGGRGLVGYGIQAFEPPCAFGCRDAIAGATLNCSETMEMDHMESMDMGGMVMTEPDCYATDDAFLQTLAWCVASRCKGIPAWKLEKYWKENVAGTDAAQPDPKETYQQALDRINGTPTAVYVETGSLNETSVVAEELWFAAYNTDSIFGHQESQQEGYGLVILLSGVAIPIAFSLLRFVPFPGALRSKFNALIIDPPLFGTKHDTPILFGLAQMPTRGQALFISYFISINTVLSAVNYQNADPNTWYPGNSWRWMLTIVSNRLGLLSFANLPLVFLYAGRNNFLLWVTNWSHSTFLIMHRWIAAIATLQAILHSILYLDAYVKAGTHASASKLPYWYWGIIATLGMTLIFPLSTLPIRKKLYEFFLVWHIVISILIVAGCYWHIVFEFKHQWGYEVWIIVTIAVWAFDRVFRVLRLARHGIKRAEITIIDDDYIRVNVSGISTSGHAYLYFPTLTWRVWENHPFSVASTILPISSHSHVHNSSEPTSDIEKQIVVSASPVHSASESNRHASSSTNFLKQSFQSGSTFYIRTQTGITQALRHRTSLPILIEAGYSSHSPSSLRTSPTLIALAGGVGITAVLPHLRTHSGRVKLYWASRSQKLVDSVTETGALSGVEQEFFVGQRLAVKETLESELVSGAKSEVIVLVSGPEGMIDEVRNTIGEIVKMGKGIRVRLVVESFSW